MMKQVLSLQGVEMSSTVLQSILGYLRKFVVLYLPYRPLLSSDFYVIVAITLASTSQENVPFKAAVEVLKLLHTGRMVENAKNRGKGVRGDQMMKEVMGEVMKSGQKSLCFLVFQWAYDNHLNELLLDVARERCE